MFIFYDVETTGTSIEFDQILQFAAILTDEDLNEVDRFEVRCRLLPWVVPAPMAMLVTGVHPRQLEDRSLPTFFEMMSTIRSRLENWAPAIFVGYNSFRFDEPLLQRALWQSLYPPYMTVTNGNSRMDMLPIARASELLRDSPLNIPTSPSGKQSFKLDRLAPANGFEHENAHDALADVEATIHIAKLIAQTAPDYWRVVANRTTKLQVSDVLANEGPVLVVENRYSVPVVWWGKRIDDEGHTARNALVADLEKDLGNTNGKLEADTVEQVEKYKKLVRRITLNRSALVFGPDEAFRLFARTPSDAQIKNCAMLSERSTLRDTLKFASAEENDRWPLKEHIEQKIFDGFPSRRDEMLMKEFHATDQPDRRQLSIRFEDVRYRQLAQRILLSDYPNQLPADELSQLQMAVSRRIVANDDSNSPWRTLDSAKKELEQARSHAPGSAILDEMEDWLEALARNHGV